MSTPPAVAPGTLAVVALPLGNPADITARAIEVLRAVDLIAAEDTRTARRQLSAHGVRATLVSYHDWNEEERARALVDRLARGERVALVCEAGTPGISDPGYDVVRLARLRGLPVIPVPGPCALTAFLSVSGLPTDAFSFHGFPPSRPSKRRALLAGLAGRAETLVFYESPRRIVAALGDALEVLGNREAALGRELTKTHEEFFFGPLCAIRDALASRPKVLGEVCWGVRGAAQHPQTGADDPEAALAEVRAAGLPPREAARELGRRCGLSVKEAYELLVQGRTPKRGARRSRDA
jgi:16S rRNA (cytidine1402-2'-O)-methyltransferase